MNCSSLMSVTWRSSRSAFWVKAHVASAQNRFDSSVTFLMQLVLLNVLVGGVHVLCSRPNRSYQNQGPDLRGLGISRHSLVCPFLPSV